MTEPKPPGAFARLIRALSPGPAGTDAGPRTVFEADSEYSHITVRDSGGIRTLYLGEAAQESETSISLADPSAPIFEYPGMMLLSLAVSPLNSDITLIGLGGGFIPRLFQECLPQRRLTVAEVDPLVAEVASTYFFFTPGGNVTLAIADGLEHVASMLPDAADQIWLDAFTGNYIPPHMATDGFIELCRSRLKPGGMLVQNLHQTKMECYRMQLRRTMKIFGGDPLVLSGRKSANAVVMSARSDGEAWIPPGTKKTAALAREFGIMAGPYNLTLECMKRVANPTWGL